MRAKKSGLLLVALLLAASSAACVPCKHPLSDEKTSKVDERLIGEWLVYDDGKPDDGESPLYIGKKPGAENVLELVECMFDQKSHVEIERAPLYTTTLGSLHLISYPVVDEENGTITAYNVCRYEMPNADSFNVYVTDESVFQSAIVDKRLAGTVKAKTYTGWFGWDGGVSYSDPKVTASPEELRSFIEKTGKKCFLSDAVYTLRRVKRTP